MSGNDYYEVLGVNRAENLQGIQTAYRKLAKQCHPDLAGVKGKEKFQAIQEAYEVLSDPGKRKDYDASINQRRMRRTHRPEPLVPSHYPSRFTRPEPLISPSSLTSRPFCEDFRSRLGFPCLFCQGLEPTRSNIAQFIMSCLRAFRIEPF